MFRPIRPIKSNGAFSQHRCDEDDMEGRFKKIVVSPFTETPEQKHEQALERRPALPQAQHIAHNNNTNGGAGKWEGKQSGRNGNNEYSCFIRYSLQLLFHDFYSYLTHILNLNIEGRKGYQPKKLPRAPINDIAEELRHRSLSESPRPLVIADPGATVPVNGSHHSGEHSPPQVRTFQDSGNVHKCRIRLVQRRLREYDIWLFMATCRLFTKLRTNQFSHLCQKVFKFCD